MKRFTTIKSFFGILAMLALLVPPWTPATAANSQIGVMIDGQTIALDQPAIMSQGRVLVPLRGVFEKLGATVNYDATQQRVTASRGATLITLFMNSTRTLVNGTPGTLDAPPLMLGSRVLVPLRFVSEALGANVKWQAYNQTVSILSGTGGADLPYAPTQQPNYNAQYQQPYYNSQNNGPFQLNLIGPAPASAVPATFDVSGTTQPNATVRISVISDMPRHGFLGMSGATSTTVLDTTTVADSAGNFIFHVNAGNLASGAHIVVSLSASNVSGGSSNQLRMEYSRQ